MNPSFWIGFDRYIIPRYYNGNLFQFNLIPLYFYNFNIEM